jgi:hypothetical protein
MNRSELLKVVEKYCRENGAETGAIKVVRIPDQKTIYIEQNGTDGRSLVLSEHKVDGKTYWAGYSSYSATVYISQAA